MKFLHIFYRLIFGLSLISLGVKTLLEVDRVQPFVTQTVDQVQHKFLKKDFNISILKDHAHNIVFAEAFLLISSGLLTIFGFCLAKVTAFAAIFIELTLVHNAYFYIEPKHLLMASAYLGLLGGVLNI